jgi:hypothetical protein
MTEALYSRLPTGFGGIQHLLPHVSRAQAKRDLSRIDAYTLYYPARRRFKRRQIVAYRQYELLAADLISMLQHKRENSNHGYILLVICVFSKMIFLEPLKTKRPLDVIKAFDNVFKRMKPTRPVKLLHVDEGLEFFSKKMEAYFKRRGIHRYATHSGVKSSIAERAVRTVRTRLARIFYTTGRHHYIKWLPKLEQTLNTTRHRTTGFRPIDVTPEVEPIIFQKVYGTEKRPTKAKFKVGQKVRLSLIKGVFAKPTAEQTFTDEIFKIQAIHPGHPTVYTVADISGQSIAGKVYAEEIVAVEKDETDTYDIERIISRRRRQGRLEYKVRFRGYGPEEDRWITASDIVRR